MDLSGQHEQSSFQHKYKTLKISGKQQNPPKQQNLSSNEIRKEKPLRLFPEKDAHIGCVSPQSLRFKRSILLQNLTGPSYLELRV